MTAPDLSKFELFEPILDFRMGNEYIDLHNDYYCNEIKEIPEKQNIIMYFLPVAKGKIIAIEFEQAQLAVAKFNLNDKTKYSTLNNFHRGKFILPTNQLNETNANEQKYFYLDFYEGQHLEIMAKQIVPFYA